MEINIKEAEYVLDDSERLVTLLRGKIDEAEKEKHLDGLIHNINEIKKLLGICNNNPRVDETERKLR